MWMHTYTYMYIRFTYFSNAPAIYRDFVSTFVTNNGRGEPSRHAFLAQGVNEKQTIPSDENLHLLLLSRCTSSRRSVMPVSLNTEIWIFLFVFDLCNIWISNFKRSWTKIILIRMFEKNKYLCFQIEYLFI